MTLSRLDYKTDVQSRDVVRCGANIYVEEFIGVKSSGQSLTTLGVDIAGQGLAEGVVDHAAVLRQHRVVHLSVHARGKPNIIRPS